MSLKGFPMVVLMWTVLMLCHPFFKRETRKLRPMRMFYLSSSSVMSSLPMATFMQVAFLSWNLMLALTSSTLAPRSSFWETTYGNIPILFKTGPKAVGIFFTRESLAIRTEYFLAHFLISFLSLLNVFKPSKSIVSTFSPFSLAICKCLASPIRQIFNPFLGMCGSLTVPANLLSFYGS